jgi:hypothetical protein
MKPATAAKKNKGSKEREGGMPPELRDLEKYIEAFAQEFSFARDRVDGLRKRTARVVEAWWCREAKHRQEHHLTRANLNTMFPRIEKWIADSGEEQQKIFFRRVWRDDIRKKREGGPAATVSDTEDELRIFASPQFDAPGKVLTPKPGVAAKTTEIEVLRQGGRG